MHFSEGETEQRDANNVMKKSKTVDERMLGHNGTNKQNHGPPAAAKPSASSDWDTDGDQAAGPIAPDPFSPVYNDNDVYGPGRPGMQQLLEYGAVPEGQSPSAGSNSPRPVDDCEFDQPVRD